MSEDEAVGAGFDPNRLDEVTLAVRDLIGRSRELAGRMAKATGRNANDMAAVGMLIQFGPMGAVELAERLAIRSASATALIDRLERAGQAVRVRDTDDRRRIVVTATPAGRDTELATWLPVIHAIDRACSRLTDAEREPVLRFLRDVTAVVDGGGQPPCASPKTQVTPNRSVTIP